MRRQTDAARDALNAQLERIAPSIRYVIGIDPSSTKTGLALVYVGSETVLEMASVSFTDGTPTLDRLRQTPTDIHEWITELPIRIGSEQCPSDEIAFAVETPSPSRSGKTRKESGGFGLTTYARAVGRVEAMVEGYAHTLDQVVLVDERTWTGKVSKAARTAAIDATVPRYDPTQDPGQDIADAIGVALWTTRQLKALRGAR